jgi:N-acetylglucosamine-6-phosphate deacetylase
VSPGSLIIEDDRIVAIEPRVIDAPAGATRVDLSGRLVVPGFIDVHVHGLEGHDVLDGPDAIGEVASRLPRYGVTSFCPTSIACPPSSLRRLLATVDHIRHADTSARARVLPSHLESNFINPEYNGAQPLSCLRSPRRAVASPRQPVDARLESGHDFTGSDILDVIAAHRGAVSIVTLAPEIDGGMELVHELVAAGHIVSIGHSGASYEQTLEAIGAGVSHATHLFNRMTPLRHRAPGVPGAVLESPGVAAELICDGFHVYPAVMRVAIRTKGEDGIVAITDGTAGAGLPVGSRTHLGGRPIVVTERTAELDDGTVAGSVLTMDGAFRTLVRLAGVSVVGAARLCASNPARQLGLSHTGRIAVGLTADLTVLDRELRVQQTYIGGRPWRNTAGDGNV